MELSFHPQNAKKRVDLSPGVMVGRALLFWLCDHRLSVYNVQQDVTFLHLCLGLLQGSASGETSCERQ